MGAGSGGTVKFGTGEIYTIQPGDYEVAGLDCRSGGNIIVYKHQDNTYSVIRDDIMRHPYGDADMAIRALCFYLTGKC